MRTIKEMQDIISAGLGKKDCDLILKDVTLVNVFSKEIYKTDIAILAKRIVSICKDSGLSAKRVIDCSGKYAVPGFIDAHMHFETTMLTPEALSDVVIPKGTTTLCADLMEIANVAGGEGIACMLKNKDTLPYRMIVQVSSRVPTAPGLETTGAVIGPDEVAVLMKEESSISLGEMDPEKILSQKPEYLEKIFTTLSLRKIANGHAIGRMGQELNVYASSGISDDHECVTAEEMISRLRLGMKVLIREGSTERNLDALVKGILDEGLSCENLCFCIDDKHVDEIRHEGHINYNVNRAISLGLPAIDAVCMATINTAKHFRIEDEIGSITPGRLADIILCDDINDIQPTQVYFEGKLVFDKNEKRPSTKTPQYPDWIKQTVILKKPVTKERFAVASNKDSVRVNLIELIDRQIINNWSEATLKVANGEVLCDTENDVIKIAVAERYGKTGDIGVGYIRGFGIKKGAFAYSMSHDHHNIVVVGVSDEDMALCVNTIAEMQGGIAVVIDGKVVGKMALPIGGLMSEFDADTVEEQLSELNEIAKQTGCPVSAPFMALSFVSLPTVPELGITDKGLVDVINHCLIPLIIES